MPRVKMLQAVLPVTPVKDYHQITFLATKSEHELPVNY